MLPSRRVLEEPNARSDSNEREHQNDYPIHISYSVGLITIDGTTGVRFARNCHPDDLWTSYFTSSKYVQAFREQHGEPDIIEVRQTFNDSLQAREWEHKVLRRLGVIRDEKWLNRGNGKAIPPSYGPKHTIEFKKKQSERMKQKNPMVGRVQSETEKDIRQEIRKRPRSFEAKKRISQGKMGDKNPNFGKSYDFEYRRKMSERLKGRKFSEEHRNNLKGPKAKKECICCKGMFSPHILSRYHNEKCKGEFNVL